MINKWRSQLCVATLAAGMAAITGAPLLGGSPGYQAPDNTATNKADRSTDAPTADKAKNDKTDRALMKNIRRDLVKDKSLSTYAHNVKVVAIGGKVTLRGPVKSDDEKKAIEEHATKHAGAGNVTNELTVKGS